MRDHVDCRGEKRIRKRRRTARLFRPKPKVSLPIEFSGLSGALERTRTFVGRQQQANTAAKVLRSQSGDARPADRLPFLDSGANEIVAAGVGL